MKANFLSCNVNKLKDEMVYFPFLHGDALYASEQGMQDVTKALILLQSYINSGFNEVLLIHKIIILTA